MRVTVTILTEKLLALTYILNGKIWNTNSKTLLVTVAALRVCKRCTTPGLMGKGGHSKPKLLTDFTGHHNTIQ